MARRGKKTADRPPNASQPPQVQAKASEEAPAPLEDPQGVKRFERPLPKGVDGLAASGDIILAREIKPQEARYPEYLRERAISALIELERRAYRNFEEALALAAAAADVTDAVLNLPTPEKPSCPSSGARPVVVEELSSSSGGSRGFGFLEELLRLLSLDFAIDSWAHGCQLPSELYQQQQRQPQQQQMQPPQQMRQPQQPRQPEKQPKQPQQQQPQQHQRQLQQHKQQQQPQQQEQPQGKWDEVKVLQRLDLLQRLASTEPETIKEALTRKETDESGNLHLSLLEKLSAGGDSSESLHLALLEKLSFADEAAKKETPKKESPPKPLETQGVSSKATKGTQSKKPYHSIWRQLQQRQRKLQQKEEEDQSENLHLSLLERIGSLEDLPLPVEGDSQALHLSLLFGRSLSLTEPPENGPQAGPQSGPQPTQKEVPKAPETTGAAGAGYKPANEEVGQDARRRVQPLRLEGSGAARGRGVQGRRLPGGAPARHLFTAWGRDGLGSSSSCSGSSSSSCEWIDETVASLSCNKPAAAGRKPNKAVAVGPVGQRQEQQQQQQQLGTLSNTSALRSVSPAPWSRRPAAPASTAQGGFQLSGGNPLLLAAAPGTRRPASAVPRPGTLSPETFWEVFQSRTAHKMLKDGAPSEATAHVAPVAAPCSVAVVHTAMRPATPAPEAPTAPQISQGSQASVGGAGARVNQGKKGAWLWIDSGSSLDTPCPGGCGSRCEEKPMDAESSVGSLHGPEAQNLALRGTPVTQQQQQQQQHQPQGQVTVRVAGPMEANGRLPLLMDAPLPASMAGLQAANLSSQQQQMQPQEEKKEQQQQQQQQEQNQVASKRNKRRSRKRRSSGRCAL